LKSAQNQAALALASVVVIDDDAPFRRSLTRLLEEAGHQPKAYESFDHFEASGMIPQEGCVVLDLHLPRSNGLEIQEKLTLMAPAVCIVFLTGFGQVAASVRAMKRGAFDFLEKPVEDVVLLQAVEHALNRSRSLNKDRAECEELHRRIERLSSRERDVFALITSGLLNKQAAAELGITERTVKHHRRNIMDKLETESLAELAKIAERVDSSDKSAESPARNSASQATTESSVRGR
jgi:FixJ family two-component response regulator